MPVDSKHTAFENAFPKWEKITDAIGGEEAVKKRKTRYLPKPNAHDDSDENAERYKAYLARAVFNNITGRTVDNMTGQVFAVDPTSEIPDGLKAVENNADGAGVSLAQLAKKTLKRILGLSRAGLLVDYPKTSGPVSKADAEEGGIRPNIMLIDPQKIINWRVESVGVESKLTLVVIEEKYISKPDEFKPELSTQYRALRLKDGLYVVEIWRKGDGDSEWKIAETLEPTDGNGNRLNEITFTFVGAESNDADVEKPLMLDICNLNLAHYRDSADYQESVYMNGQGTPWIAGLNDGWVERHMSGGVQIGSRSIIPLPEGASAGILQSEANGIVKEAMDQKLADMESLGAKLVERREVQQTATEKAINSASETSILADCANNVTEAFALALYWAGLYHNVEIPDGKENTVFELNTDFAVARITPEERQANREDYNSGLITWEEARDKLRRGGAAYLDDKQAQTDIEERSDEELEHAKKMFAAQKQEEEEPPAGE